MAYDIELAARVELAFEKAGSAYETKKMMGGLCFMVDDKMCIGVEREDLMVRIGPDAYEAALEEPGCRPMDFTGRPLKGFVYVDIDAVRSDSQLDRWLKKALAFNPLAKRSKSKKRK